MRDEQREAIDTLKEITENDLLNYWEGPEKPYNAIEIVLSLIKEQQEEIEKKDKQIDLMAEYISKRDVEEDICMKNKTNPDWCNEDYTNCQGCIKKYFAGLVEKE